MDVCDRHLKSVSVSTKVNNLSNLNFLMCCMTSVCFHFITYYTLLIQKLFLNEHLFYPQHIQLCTFT